MFQKVSFKDPYFQNNYMDIYSIGVIITELFSEFNTEMERIIILSNLKDGKINDKIPNKIKNIIQSCITNNEIERYCIYQLQDKVEKTLNNFQKEKIDITDIL